MPAELGVHGLRAHGTDLLSLHRVAERLHHGARGGPVEIAAVILRAGVDRDVLRDLREILARLQALQDLLRVSLRADEDVAHVILSRAVSGLFPIVSSAHFSFGHRVSLHVLRDHSLREDIVLRLTESGAHSGVRRFKLLLGGFLKEHFLSDESVLHVLFKLRRALVALSDGALNQVLLLGSRDLVAVHGNVRDSGERRGAREDDAGENGGGGFHLHWNDSKKNRWFGQRVNSSVRNYFGAASLFTLSSRDSGLYFAM